MRRGSGLVLGMLWLLMADLATAGDYVMMIGKGVEVCEAYLKNLNSFPEHPPMVCERPLNPKLSELRKPEWKMLDVVQNLDLLRKVEQTLRGLTDAQWEAQQEQWAEKVKERVAKGWVSLSTTQLDVDRDGVHEIVLRYVNDPGGCDPTNEGTFANPGGSPSHFVLTSDQRKIDVQKTQLAFPRYGGRPDVFVYNEMWYLTTWAGNLNFQGGQLDLHTVQPIPRRPCEFKYKGQVARRQP
jgi:hypothetical protein